jgi:hypothetical protein
MRACAGPDDGVRRTDSRVETEGCNLRCIVKGRHVPLPVVILHPDCTLKRPGDAGRLGVPVMWAIHQGLLPGLRP